MQKVTLTLSRLVAIAATSTFCLLATSCGSSSDAEKAKKDAEARVTSLTTEVEKFRKVDLKTLLPKIIAGLTAAKVKIDASGKIEINDTGGSTADVTAYENKTVADFMDIKPEGGEKKGETAAH